MLPSNVSSEADLLNHIDGLSPDEMLDYCRDNLGWLTNWEVHFLDSLDQRQDERLTVLQLHKLQEITFKLLRMELANESMS